MSDRVSSGRGRQTHTIRPLAGPAELAQAEAAFRTALVGISFPEVENIEEMHEPGRVLGACDGEAVVACAESFASWLTVPGGARLPHAAVTSVGVLPTHTRRGILTTLMAEQLRDVAARGEIVASLRASEGVIYERFGYGVATRSARYEVTRSMAALRPGVGAGSAVRLADPAHSEAICRAVYERVGWVGSVGRFDAWWKESAAWATLRPGPRYLVLSGEGDDVDGFAFYRPDTKEWFSGAPRRIEISDFVAVSDAAYIGLIRHFCGIDLSEVFSFSGPVDDPISGVLTNPRAAKLVANRDETWLRLIDVEAALGARSYTAGPDVVIAVSDGLLPANNGSYVVGGAGVRRSDAAPELSLDVSALAGVYLGGTRWSELALAGRVSEHRAGAVADAEALFRTARAPFAGTGF